MECVLGSACSSRVSSRRTRELRAMHLRWGRCFWGFKKRIVLRLLPLHSALEPPPKPPPPPPLHLLPLPPPTAPPPTTSSIITPFLLHRLSTVEAATFRYRKHDCFVLFFQKSINFIGVSSIHSQMWCRISKENTASPRYPNQRSFSIM
jgi:hypothetical protein